MIESNEEELAGTEALPEEGFNVGDAPKCPECGGYVGMLKWLPPFRVELETWGTQFGDVICLTEELLVTNRFKRICEENELTGLTGFVAVDVVRVKNHRRLTTDPPQYLKADVVRSQAAIDIEASGYEWAEKEPTICPVCRLSIRDTVKRWQRIVIEPGTWTGEDIFIPRGGEIITSNRFKAVCEAHEVTNVVFIAAENFSHDFYPWENHAHS